MTYATLATALVITGLVACSSAAPVEHEHRGESADAVITCVRPGRECTNSAQCCNLRCLDTGFCHVAPDECVGAGGACTSSAQCCNLRCLGSGRCAAVETGTCLGAGAACAGASECCSFDCALDGYCR